MKKIILIFLFLVVPFAVCAYTAYTTHAVGDNETAWIFVAFGALFGIPLAAIVLKAIKKRVFGTDRSQDESAEASEKPLSTPFVPHWFMMTAIVIFGGVVLFNVIRVILAIIKKTMS